ncbi:MAG TPA: hypothetical protein VK498_09000, partial [Ferruginibacter sp.]|nr:hypothetical protein [Ferruginibacter sp.]
MQYLFRRKIIFRTLVILLCPAMASAQRLDMNLPDHDYKAFHFGINVGANRSHYNFSHHPLFMQTDSVMVVESINSTGINLAWLVNMRLGEHFDIRTYPLNLVFTEKAFQYHLKYPDRPGGED